MHIRGKRAHTHTHTHTYTITHALPHTLTLSLTLSLSLHPASYRPPPATASDRLPYLATVAARFVSQSEDDHQFLLATPAATCLEYDLHPRPPLQTEANLDWRTLCLEVTPRAELDLCRQFEWQDCLAIGGDVLCASSQRAAAPLSRSNEWFSNVEITTHHADRPLWSVPQFTFKPVGVLASTTSAAPMVAGGGGPPSRDTAHRDKGKQPADEPAVITFSAELRSDAPIARSLLGNKDNVSQGIADAMGASLVDVIAAASRPIATEDHFHTPTPVQVEVHHPHDPQHDQPPPPQHTVQQHRQPEPQHASQHHDQQHSATNAQPVTVATVYGEDGVGARAPLPDRRGGTMVLSHERHPTPPRRQSPVVARAPALVAQLEGLAAALDTGQFEVPAASSPGQPSHGSSAGDSLILRPPQHLLSPGSTTPSPPPASATTADLPHHHVDQSQHTQPLAHPDPAPAVSPSPTTGAGVEGDDNASWVRGMRNRIGASWGTEELSAKLPETKLADVPLQRPQAHGDARLPPVNIHTLDTERRPPTTQQSYAAAAAAAGKREPAEDAPERAMSAPSTATQEAVLAPTRSKARQRRHRNGKGNGKQPVVSSSSSTNGTTLGAPATISLSNNPFSALQVSESSSSSDDDDGDQDPVLAFNLGI
jgi:BCAS3 microtubule associated cell migration factor, C-terminal